MSRHLLSLLVSLLLVSSTFGRTRRPVDAQPLTVESLLSGLRHTSPATWHRGMPFAFIADAVGLSLVPEAPLAAADTLPLHGSRWTYDSMVSDEDWMGQQLLQLRFLSPQGRAYRYSTGRPLSSMADTSYLPAIEPLYPLDLIVRCDSLLSSRTLYILCNDERVIYPADSLPGATVHPKYVPVTVDSVRVGHVLAPLCVYFSSGSERGYFFTSLPGSRQVATSTPVTRFLSLTDPYLAHPDITPEVWSRIQHSQVAVDMTAEEVRLSWGRPSRVERGPSRSGIVELWFYSNNRVLQLWDGRLSQIGIL